MPFDLRHLRHFEAVHRLKNFNQAAEEQLVTQSAITKSIQALEEMIGVKLFDRTTRSVVPTAEGEHLLVHAEELLRRALEFEREAHLLQSAEVGEVNVGSGPYPPDTIIAPAIRRFSEKHTQVSVRVRTGDTDQLLERLMKHANDFVVCDMSRFEGSPQKEEIDVIPLPPEPVVLISAKGHPLSQEKGDMNLFFRYPWVTTGSTPHYARIMDKHWTPASSAYTQSRYNVESVATCLTLVEDSKIVTPIPKSLAKRVCRNRALTMTELPIPLVTNDGIHSLKGRTPSAAARTLVEDIQIVAHENVEDKTG